MIRPHGKAKQEGIQGVPPCASGRDALDTFLLRLAMFFKDVLFSLASGRDDLITFFSLTVDGYLNCYEKTFKKANSSL